MNKALITFDRLEALKHEMLIKIHVIVDDNQQWHEIERINVPRMIDVLGNKYYLVNRNKYLKLKVVTTVRIIVEVPDNGVVEKCLIEWLNSRSIAWEKIPETQEVPKDENRS